jgi:acyl carrier protein
MQDKIKQIMSAIFEIPAKDIEDNSSPDTIEKWDSLQHINLVSSLEEEFDIRLSDEEIIEMMNFGLIVYIIKQKTNT